MSVGDWTVERQHDVRTPDYRWMWSVKTNDIDEPCQERQEYPTAICSWSRSFWLAVWRAWRQSRHERKATQ